MNWCNGFSTTLTLQCRSLSLARCTAARRAPGGRWQLLVGHGQWQHARLNAAWLAGPCAGLAFEGAAGSRYKVLVLAPAQSPDDWRRLRVHLKLPRT